MRFPKFYKFSKYYKMKSILLPRLCISGITKEEFLLPSGSFLAIFLLLILLQKDPKNLVIMLSFFLGFLGDFFLSPSSEISGVTSFSRASSSQSESKEALCFLHDSDGATIDPFLTGENILLLASFLKFFE